MRKMFLWIVAAGLILGLTGWISVADAEEKPQIVDIIGKKTLLLDDGSMWSEYNNQMIHTRDDIAFISGNDRSGLAVTRDGKLVNWGFGSPPFNDEDYDQSQVLQVSGQVWLGLDGKVRGRSLDNILLINETNQFFGALSQKGELLLEDRYKIGSFNKLGIIPDPTTVKEISVLDGRMALLYNSGKVVVFEASNFDDDGNIIPYSVTEDAVHIEYVQDSPTDRIIVTCKDGTVWTTGEYQDRKKLAEQMSGLSQIVKTVVLDGPQHFYAKRSNGSWVLYDEGKLTPIEPPVIKTLSVSVSNLKPQVGDDVKVDILENYSNNAKIRITASMENVTIQKPQLLKLQPKGTFKVMGVGETEVTVIQGGLSKTVKLSASLNTNLKFAKQSKGVVYVPVKSVFKALGGTVAVSAGGAFDVKVGEKALTLKAGDVNATLNGQALKLKAAPLAEKGDMLVPASLLTDVLGASIQWNAKLENVVISFGQAKMTVVTANTAALVKKAAQGSLTQYIGKTYWINYFQLWDRFTKVTVTDVLPDDTGSFTIVFKTASGKKLTSYSMSYSEVTDVLGDSVNFLSYDPYKKYKWSSSIWQHVKAGEVVLGMTKDQVLFSIGSPTAQSTTTAKGVKIETWVYSNFDTVSFSNGQVTLIITY
ncbi:copper amine oxidase [Paenibacillus psychroresistens]|uniref:Copper amine oxidase n=1 Tax=Paenibacillus psychroresistens TaxID=1778678 RepID=A0A6B8RNG2_9BACL|nr:stalk domain-containing protein [Paenibacillus psychroresistens]QGQ97860.1 copper amine oxidase [Paenibacillus psychroresistens]